MAPNGVGPDEMVPNRMVPVSLALSFEPDVGVVAD